MNNLKKLSSFLKHQSWTWTIFTAFILYIASSKMKTSSDYTFNWVQALIATLGILLGMLSIVKFGFWLFFRKLHDYLYGHRCKPDPSKPAGEGNPPQKFFNASFHDFRGLDKAPYEIKWLKLVLTLFMFSVLLIIAVIIFLKVISVSTVGDIYVSN
jgi:hypothetical protein